MDSNKKHTQSIEISGTPIHLETGRLARLADGAVYASQGETVVLATAVIGEKQEESDYFPLLVEYEERLYAGGIIKGSRFIKREGRPRDEAVLNARLIDRSIRHLFSKDFTYATQVIVTILSVDEEHDPAILGLNAASAALQLAGVPWKGPVGATRVGMLGGELLLNPKVKELEISDLNLVVSGTREHVVMIEAGANEVSEEKFLAAIEKAQEQNQKISQAISEFALKAGARRLEYETEELEGELKMQVENFLRDLVDDTHLTLDKEARAKLSKEYQEKLFEHFSGTTTKANLKAIFNDFERKKVRELILEENRRIDGRALDEIRPLRIKVGVLPRTHGSAIFERGDTQVLTTVTLGSTSLEQLIESMSGEETKRYIHHYNFPPFSTGEVGRIGLPKRREIGHGALAERALKPMIPDEKSFPYTIRLVSEVLTSNGSTSMASTCGSTLALMDAGVPIKKPVSGIAMGLVKEGTQYRILSDIQGVEDFYGDMDLKVAGTQDGITALQMDSKAGELPPEILEKALYQAQKGRLYILEKMREVIPEPRKTLSKYAPKIKSIQINPQKIGNVIGQGGRVIRDIQQKTNTLIDIQEDGTIFVSGTDSHKVKEAIEMIKKMTTEVAVGQIYKGTVTRVTDFGAFVEILPGIIGLVHVSELSPRYVSNVRQEVSEGDQIEVKVIGIDELGRISLSRKALKARQRHRPR